MYDQPSTSAGFPASEAPSQSILTSTVFPSLVSKAADLVTVTVAPLINNTSTVSSQPQVLQLMEQLEMVKRIYEWLIPAMIVILLLAVVGNGVICLSAPFLSRPVSPYLRLCISLAAADMWAASLLITGLLVNSYLPVVVGMEKQTRCADAILEIFRVSGMLTSDWHLFALAINQFVGTVWPLKYRMIVTHRRVRCLILLLWIVPFLFTVGWFVWFEDDGLRHHACHFHFYNQFPFRITIFLLFTLPLLATLVLYAMILSSLLKAKAQFKPKDSEGEPCLNRVNRRSHVISKLKLVWTTLLIVSTFSLSWGLCVLYFILVCQEGCMFVYRVSISFYLSLFISSLVNCLVMIKLAANPFIYTLRIKAIHKSVEGLLKKLKGVNPRHHKASNANDVCFSMSKSANFTPTMTPVPSSTKIKDSVISWKVPVAAEPRSCV